MLTMDEAKNLAKANLATAAGEVFSGVNGAVGTILAEMSARGKIQAEFTCGTSPGCTNLHIREISDWHQCGTCPQHKKSKSGKSGGTQASTGELNTTRELKILANDPPEVVAKKKEYNEVIAELNAVEKKARDEKAAEAKKVKAEADAKAKEAKDLERKAAQAKELEGRIQAIKDLAAKKGIGISAKSVAAPVQEAKPEDPGTEFDPSTGTFPEEAQVEAQ